MDNQPEALNSDLLDREQIQMLLEAGASESAELFEELLTMYEGESQEKLNELQKLLDDGNLRDMGRASHALAGSSANVGAKQVWATAKEIENASKSDDDSEIPELFKRLLDQYQVTLVDLRSVLEALKS